MIFLRGSSPISSVWLLCCVVDVQGTIQGSQIPLGVQHKRELLISMRHPVYKQTVNLFTDGTVRIARLRDLVGYALQSLSWHALFPWVLSLQQIPDARDKQALHFSYRYTHLKVVVFVVSSSFWT